MEVYVACKKRGRVCFRTIHIKMLIVSPAFENKWPIPTFDEFKEKYDVDGNVGEPIDVGRLIRGSQAGGWGQVFY